MCVCVCVCLVAFLPICGMSAAISCEVFWVARWKWRIVLLFLFSRPCLLYLVSPCTLLWQSVSRNRPVETEESNQITVEREKKKERRRARIRGAEKRNREDGWKTDALIRQEAKKKEEEDVLGCSWSDVNQLVSEVFRGNSDGNGSKDGLKKKGIKLGEGVMKKKEEACRRRNEDSILPGCGRTSHGSTNQHPLRNYWQ